MMHGKEFQMRASSSPISMTGDKVLLYAFDVDLDKGINRVAEPLEFKTIERYTESPSFCELTKQEAQILMDDLWLCGLRPSEGTGSAGSLKATQNHLDDLRRLVFKSFSDSQMKIR